MQKTYSKLLIAKYSPENKCFVEDGAILTVLPRKKPSTVRNSISHYFIDSLDRKTKSRYGWVKQVEPFLFEYFIATYCKNTENEEELEHVRKMLDAAAVLEVDKPVAATYFERGVEEKRLEFSVHRVFFR